MKKRKIIPYDKKLKELAKNLRNNSTKSEIYLWSILKNKQFHGFKFIRQKPIDKYILDFYCPELELAIELDGYSHQLEEVQEKDLMKVKRLNEFNIAVLRFSDFQVFNDIENVINALEFYIFEFEEPSQEENELE